MCGIVGIFGLEGIEKPQNTLEAMLQKMEHRGPDARGIWLGSNIALGHQRLSIIDLSEAANQPFHSKDGRYTVVFNGEIYNYQSIRAQLNTEFNFTTDSDTEVLLAAFQKWGRKALQLLNGMFAFAIWDAQKESLFVARDRVGIKPLYYSQVGTSFLFASEVRSILASGLISRKVSNSAISEFLRYQTVHTPNTLLESVKSLPAGHYIEWSDNEMNINEYWRPWQSFHFDQDPIHIQKNIREKLTQSIERRLIADVPLGAFLSGGIDSSLLVGIARERLGRNLDTFNVSFDESEFSEAKFARQVAKKFNANHHEIKLQPQDLLNQLPDALAAIDHPSGDGPNTWLVSKETKKQGITVALSGLGGDELFAGYDVFKRIPYIAERNWILSFPKGLRKLIGNFQVARKPGMTSLKQREVLTLDYYDLQHLYPVFRKVLLDEQMTDLMPNGSISKDEVKKLIHDLEQYDEFEQLPTLSRISVVEMSTYMNHVLLRDTDQMSMAHALEVRVPFLDHELIEYVTRINDVVKFPHSPKKLLIDSFSDLLPAEVVNRPKMGFVLPWEHWLKNELSAFSQERIDLLKDTRLLNADGVEELWRNFQNGSSKVSWSRVWPLVALSDWMYRNELH